MPMRPTSVRVDAAESSAWIPINRYATSIAILAAVLFSTNKNLTVSVEYCTDPLVPQPVRASRSTTTLTITLANHGLTTSDWINLSQFDAALDGNYKVASVTNENVFTVTVANTGATTSSGTNAQVIPMRVFTHDVLAGLTADASSNFTVPPTAVRLTCSSYTAGYADLNLISGSK